MKNADAVGQRIDLVHEMCGYQDGCAQPFASVADVAPDDVPGHRISSAATIGPNAMLATARVPGGRPVEHIAPDQRPMSSIPLYGILLTISRPSARRPQGGHTRCNEGLGFAGPPIPVLETQMIVIERRERTIVLTGWRAWLAGAVMVIAVWLLLAFVAFVLIGVSLTMAAVMILIFPAALATAAVQSILRRARS